MSFSFGIVDKTQAGATAKVVEAVKAFVEGQEMHARDVQAVRSACVGAIGALQPAENEEVHLTAYGSASGAWQDGKYSRITGCEFTVKAHVQVAPELGK